MRFDAVLKQLDGQSVGGQLIVYKDGVHVLVGKHHDGELIDITPEGEAMLKQQAVKSSKPKKGGAIADDVQPEGDGQMHHEVMVADETITVDNTK